jgi:hypothetical protein
LFNNELGILADQELKLLVVGCVLGDHLDLVAGNVAAEGFAIFTALEVIIRAIGALAQNTEFARFHALDLSDLLKELAGMGWFHGESIYVYIYYTTKKAAFEVFS